MAVHGFHNGASKPSSLHIHHYEIPKKGERRDIGRLLKNVIFPGIYTEYADTKDAIKTVKVDTGLTENDKKVAAARAQATDKGGRLDKTPGTFTKAPFKYFVIGSFYWIFSLSTTVFFS